MVTRFLIVCLWQMSVYVVFVFFFLLFTVLIKRDTTFSLGPQIHISMY